MRKYFIVSLALLLVFGLSGCDYDFSAQAMTRATFLAVGDNLIHSSIYNQAARRAKEAGKTGYDFDFAYENVAELIDADVCLVNQETLISDQHSPSDYPRFNSPVALGEKMISLGFNIVNHANNHVLDQGTSGALATLDFWERNGIPVSGLYRNEEDMAEIRTLTVNEITFAFLGFTEHTNGLSIPSSQSLKVPYTGQRELMKEQIVKAKALADVLVVSVHWGQEYTHAVTDQQRSLAEEMANWGADLIIGTHPHVIRPMEEIQSADGRKVLVAYSLGNFISAQNRNNTMIGGMLKLTVEKNPEDAAITMTDVRFIPIITHYDRGYSKNRLYPLSQYSAELAAKHGVNQFSPFSYQFILETLNNNGFTGFETTNVND